MPMSSYYQELRSKVGSSPLFMPSVVGIVRNENSDVLFVKSSSEHSWGLPAGAIEPGETPAQAVVREIYEETGLHVSPTTLLGVFGGEQYRYTYPNGHQVEYVIFMFACSVVDGVLQPIDGETAELRYYPLHNLPTLPFPYPTELFAPLSVSRPAYFDRD